MLIIRNVKASLLVVMILMMVASVTACGTDKPNPQSSKDTTSKMEDSEKFTMQIQTPTTNSNLTDQQVFDYLTKSIPEIKEFEKGISDYNKNSKTKSKLIMRIDGSPIPSDSDPMIKSYYYVYIGSDMGDHTSRWNSFFVKQDLSEIQVEDIVKGGPISLKAWRAANRNPQ
ncbi:MAG: hypothetical protein ACM3UZ_00310 [Acidobacteriota bacterium]